jgi:hypothetical protein
VIKKQFLLIGLLLLLPGPSFAPAQVSDDRQNPVQEQKRLNSRIAELKREQDFLLFQKTASVMDSKYLVLNMTAGTGQLKYKTRVLKDFVFVAPVAHQRSPQQGMIVLTRKIDGPKRYGLIFGNDLILRGKRKLTSLEADIQPLSLDKKDLMAVFYALEQGARAYVLP